MALCIYFVSTEIKSQNEQIEYQKIDITYGLAQNTVDCIYQDKVGFLWFGTRYGLSRYDGISFVNYQNNPKDNETLSNKSINDICEDKNSNLYIATDNGLSIYIRHKQKFRQIFRDTLSKVTLPSNSVYALKMDENNRLWVGTRKGLVLYDLTSNEFISPQNLFKNASSIEKEHIMTIHVDKNNVYIGTAYSGLYILNKKEKSFSSYLISKRNQYSYLNNTIFSILADSQRNVWMATGNGIAKFNLETKVIKKYLVSDDLNKIENYIVFNDLLKTTNGELLCGSSDFGMYKYSVDTDKFLPYNIRQHESGKLSGKSYLSMIEDRTGVLWLGTRNEGLVKVNLRKKPFKWIGHDSETKNSIVDNNIFALLEDSEKTSGSEHSRELVS
ncbi:MAG: hypothetical protein HC831_14400 [Chloroflexia bacterium]|nr:hypothetical protein [Chloroflexia bacterium]